MKEDQGRHKETDCDPLKNAGNAPHGKMEPWKTIDEQSEQYEYYGTAHQPHVEGSVWRGMPIRRRHRDILSKRRGEGHADDEQEKWKDKVRRRDAVPCRMEQRRVRVRKVT